MSGELPDYYFRVRENGAIVFRVDTENRQRRIEMDQIAVINIRNGEIKPHGDRTLSENDLREIHQWMEKRSETLAYRDIDDIYRAVDHMNLTTQWAQSREVRPIFQPTRLRPAASLRSTNARCTA